MVDPFDDSIFTTIFSENPEEGKVSFEIIGTIPELRLNLINDAPEDSPLKNLQYYVDDFGTHKEYSEDDTIALHVKPSAPQDFAKKYALTRDTIEIPVKGAPKYIRSVDEVTQDVLDAVKPIAVARLEFTPSIPTFARMEVSAAKTADNTANNNHILFSLFLLYFSLNFIISLVL